MIERVRTSDLRKPMTDRVKRQALAHHAKCAVCGDKLHGDVVFAGVDQARAHHAGCAGFHVYDTPTMRRQMQLLLAQVRCTVCGESITEPRYDHRPALEQRPYNKRKKDFEPPQHDPEYIEIIHVDCHQWRTTGRKPGAAKTVTTVGSDAHIAAKVRRINRPKKPGRKILSRGFSKTKRPFNKGASR